VRNRASQCKNGTLDRSDFRSQLVLEPPAAFVLRSGRRQNTTESPVQTSMKSTELRQALNCAMKAARAAGAVMRQNRHRAKRINSQIQHDIKLELDVRCQKLIEKKLLDRFPQISVLGEEGVRGERWALETTEKTEKALKRRRRGRGTGNREQGMQN
jgi:hypothetical protein